MLGKPLRFSTLVYNPETMEYWVWLMCGIWYRSYSELKSKEGFAARCRNTLNLNLESSRDRELKCERNLIWEIFPVNLR